MFEVKIIFSLQKMLTDGLELSGVMFYQLFGF